MTAARESETASGRALRLVFMGTPPFAAVCLDALLASRHNVEAAVTQPDRRAGRGKHLRRSAVKELAQARAIEILQPERAGEPTFVERLAVIAPDLAVVVAYGRILPARVLDVPALGCINAHASLLPLLRGAAPIQHAILEGHERTGVTIMRINERMDAGDMLRSRAVQILSDDDSATLAHRLAELSAELLLETIDDIAAGRAPAVAQDESLATYAGPITRDDARIDWGEDAERTERRVRAMRPRPGAFTFDDRTRLKVIDVGLADVQGAHEPGMVVTLHDDAMIVACGRGALALRTVQPEGRRSMSAGDYQRGSGRPLPRRLGPERETQDDPAR